MYAIRHPSLPNYLALTGGSTFGITSDCTDCTARRPRAGRSARARPAISLAGLHGGPATPLLHRRRRRRVRQEARSVRLLHAGRRASGRLRPRRPADRLAADERARSLPRFIWITPNLCHDMHDCEPGHRRPVPGPAGPAAAAGARPARAADPHLGRGHERQRLLPAGLRRPHRHDRRRRRGASRAPGCARRSTTTRSCRRSRICSGCRGCGAPPAPCTPSLAPLLPRDGRDGSGRAERRRRAQRSCSGSGPSGRS